MFSIDYIVMFVIFLSVLFGLLRGFCQEFLSSVFWFFSFCFFFKYNYFNDFYIDALQNNFFKNKISILVLFFFYKKILKYFSKKIIKKINFSYLNIFLGGVFGIFRGTILVFLFLVVFKYLSSVSYNDYIKNSILISVFFKIIDYFLLIFNNFLKN